jgi:linoleoyl-CoA desaturase
MFRAQPPVDGATASAGGSGVSMATKTLGTTDPAAAPANSGTASHDLKFEPHDEFHRAIRKRVDEYFRTTGLRPRGDPRLHLKTAITLSWLVASYVLLVFVAANWWQALIGVASLGVAMPCIGFNVMHDGGHNAFSDRRWVNRLAALTVDLLGGSSYVWATKHNIVHHTYTNITGHDDDITIGVLGRLSPHQPRRAFHRFQQFYIWPFYGLIPFKWYFVDDFRDVLRGRVGDYPMPRPRGWELVFFLGGKLLYLGLAFGIPLLLHPVWGVVACYLAVSFVEGVVLAVVFQLAHVVEEAAFPMPDPESGRMAGRWAAHQVETTVDYARASRFVTWFVGGLNYQIEHHLLPHVCHIHYPALAGRIEATCREFGVKYQYRETFSAAVASHFRWLRRMGQPARG